MCLMRHLVRLVLNWKFSGILSRFCALSAIGCTTIFNSMGVEFHELTIHIYIYVYGQHLKILPTYMCMCLVSSSKFTNSIHTYTCMYVKLHELTIHTHIHVRVVSSNVPDVTKIYIYNTLQHTATHCNTLQHTAPHCTTLQHTATHCTTLQHTAPHCTTLHHTATQDLRMLPDVTKIFAYLSAGSALLVRTISKFCLLQCVAVCCSVLQCVAVCCSVLQCVAVCCSVLQCVRTIRKFCLCMYNICTRVYINVYIDVYIIHVRTTSKFCLCTHNMCRRVCLDVYIIHMCKYMIHIRIYVNINSRPICVLA